MKICNFRAPITTKAYGRLNLKSRAPNINRIFVIKICNFRAPNMTSANSHLNCNSIAP